MTPATQKDASTNSIDVGTNPNSFPDASMIIDAGAHANDSGTIWPDAQTQSPDLGTAPIDSGASIADAGFAPDAMAAPDAGFAPDAMTVPDAGFAPDAMAPADSGTPIPDAAMVSPDAGQPVIDAGPTQPPVGDPFDANTASTQIAIAQCAFYNRCEPFRFDYGLSTQPQCNTLQAAEYRIIFDAYADAITAGNIAYSQTEFDACVAAFGSSDCELGLDSDECEFFTGQRTQAQACQYSLECAPDQYCSANGVAICGMCTSRADLGQNCANDRCVDDAICAQTTTGLAICVPDDAAENATCGDVNTGYCRGRLQCRDLQANGMQSCVRPAAPNQACSRTSNNAADCNLFANQGCINNACTAISWVAPGQSCTGANDCNIDGICDLNTNFCLALPTNNQLCNNNVCAQGHFCDGNFCRTRLGQGANCTDSNQCTTGLDCLGAVGSRTCETLNWRACP